MNRLKSTNIIIGLFISIFCINQLAYSQDTVRLYYQLNDPFLSSNSKAKLDSLLYNRIIQDGKNLTIVGYADYLGSNEYNIKLSKKRAESVKQHLLNTGLKSNNIKLCIGKGEVPRDLNLPEGYAPDRRVDIVLNTINTQPKTLVRSSPRTTEKKKKNIVAKEISEVAVGNTFVLNNIYFYAGRHTVKESSLEELGQLYDALESSPNLHIQIEGHVCCIRPSAPDALDEGTFELALSVNRAKAIYQYLVAEGIDKDRLKYVGFGKRRPVVAVEKTAEDADRNRRVEIRILAK